MFSVMKLSYTWSKVVSLKYLSVTIIYVCDEKSFHSLSDFCNIALWCSTCFLNVTFPTQCCKIYRFANNLFIPETEMRIKIFHHVIKVYVTESSFEAFSLSWEKGKNIIGVFLEATFWKWLLRQKGESTFLVYTTRQTPFSPLSTPLLSVYCVEWRWQLEYVMSKSLAQVSETLPQPPFHIVAFSSLCFPTNFLGWMV